MKILRSKQFTYFIRLSNIHLVVSCATENWSNGVHWVCYLCLWFLPEPVKLLDWGEEGHRTEAEIASLRAAFTQEVAVWHKLDHPNVTKVTILALLPLQCSLLSNISLSNLWAVNSLRLGKKGVVMAFSVSTSGPYVGFH